jgi:hypothetical protein
METKCKMLPDPFTQLRIVRLNVVLVLAAIALVSCTKSPQDRCREKGLLPGTIEFVECTQPEKREALKDAKAAWGRLEPGDDR